jgi:hypothetical protein
VVKLRLPASVNLPVVALVAKVSQTGGTCLIDNLRRCFRQGDVRGVNHNVSAVELQRPGYLVRATAERRAGKILKSSVNVEQTSRIHHQRAGVVESGAVGVDEGV